MSTALDNEIAIAEGTDYIIGLLDIWKCFDQIVPMLIQVFGWASWHAHQGFVGLCQAHGRHPSCQRPPPWCGQALPQAVQHTSRLSLLNDLVGPAAEAMAAGYENLPTRDTTNPG